MKIFGHRGAAGHATENSLEAFEIAFEAGVDGIELDVKYLHGQLWVFHDDDLDRVTNATGTLMDLSERQLNQVRLLNGEPIPRLADVWDLTPPHVVINVELKGPNTAIPMVNFMREYSHQYLISSFLYDELSLLNERTPNTQRGMLLRAPREDAVELAVNLRVQNVHLWDELAEGPLIKNFLSADLNVYVFTVNTPERANELRTMGVSAVFTDLPRFVNSK